MVCDLASDAIAGLTTRLYQLLDDRHNEVAVLQRSLEPDVILSVVMASRDRRMAGIAKSVEFAWQAGVEIDDGKGDPND